MDNNDAIGEFLELEPIKKDIKQANQLVKDSKIDNDFEYARGNLYQVIENGSNALTDLLQVAQQGQHPRAYEVVATLVRTLSDANIALMDLTKKKQDITGEAVKNPNTVNNNLFVGSTGDLQKLIKKELDESS
jgi:hypothetical protein|tara:strand:- start:15 stop:413 length:399 start_codon:yes stop_codon:yes gene_type:complete